MWDTFCIHFDTFCIHQLHTSCTIFVAIQNEHTISMFGLKEDNPFGKLPESIVN